MALPARRASSCARRSGARGRSPPRSSAPRPRAPSASTAGTPPASPSGSPWATPHIQITACSEEQTDNTWRAIQPMIELGPARRDVHPRHRPDQDQPALGRPDRARHRLGALAARAADHASSSRTRPRAGSAPTTATGWPTTSAATSPAWAAASSRPATPPTRPSSPSPRAPRPSRACSSTTSTAAPAASATRPSGARCCDKVYGDSATERGGWVDLDRIDAEIEALLEHDPAQAERFFLNRKLASEGAAFDVEHVQGASRSPRTVAGAGDRLPRRRRRPPRRRDRRRRHARQDRLPVAGDHPRTPAARARGLRARLRRRSTAPSPTSSSATWSGAPTATTSTSARWSRSGRTASASAAS